MGISSTSRLIHKTVEIFTSPKSVVYIEVGMLPPLCLSISLPGSFRESEGSVLFIFLKYVVYPRVRRTRVRHRGKLAAALCILALVTSSESELRKGNDSMTPGTIFTAASQLRVMGAHPAHLGAASAALKSTRFEVEAHMVIS